MTDLGSEEILQKLKEILGLKEDENNQLKISLESGRHPGGAKLRWVYGELPSKPQKKKSLILSQDEIMRRRSASLDEADERLKIDVAQATFNL